MKTTASFFVALLFVLVSVVSAQDAKKALTGAKYDQAVANYVMALGSKNDGLRRSAIYQLGDLKASKATIPLMAVLHESNDEMSRIAAAWALCKIGEGTGTFAVKQAVRFDESKKVQLHAAWYYNLLVKDGTFAFIPAATGTTIVAEAR